MMEGADRTIMMKPARTKDKRLKPGILFAAGWLSACVLASPAAWAQQSGLTLEEAIRVALKGNEAALLADQRTEVASARLTKARAAFLPNLNLTGNYTRRPFEVVRIVGNSQIIVQNYNALSGAANASLTLFDSDSLPTLQQAKWDRLADRYSNTDTKRQLAFDVGNAFLATLGIDQVLEASRHRLEYAKQSLAAARARHAAGLVSVNDVTRAELEYATAEMGVTQVQGQVETTFLQLEYLLNSPVPRTLVTPEVLFRAVDAEIPPAEKIIAEAQGRRPDVESLRWRAKAQRVLILEPLLRWLPSLTLNGRYSYTNEAGLTGRNFNWSLGMSMNWNVFDGLTRNGDFSERQALAVQADLNLQAALRRVELDVRDALVSLESQRATLKLVQVTYDVALKNATETAELYRQGLSSALQVADANVRLFEANVDLVRARYGLGVSYLNLESALGLDPVGKEPDFEK
jgi:outer membrane protein TolC